MSTATAPTRYLSIDFYRGLTIALMLVVNTPGTWEHVFAPLLHAEWHGCSPTDLVFPSFLFIIGVSMWFSFEKYGRTLSAALLRKIAIRTGVLFGLGLLLSYFPFVGKNLASLRILGVLQRLGLCYGLAAVLVLLLPQRWLVLKVVGILLGYWALLYFAAAPGVDPYSLEHNVVRWFDVQVLGERHLWHGQNIPFDPEGLLSTLPAAVTVIFGWWAGQLLQRYSLVKMRAIQELLLWGNILAACGLLWDVAFPINKSLWTSSFVLYTAGLSMLLLAFSVWVIDVRNQPRSDGQTNPLVRFFLVFGANPLVAFVLSGVLVKTLISIKLRVPSSPTGVIQPGVAYFQQSTLYELIYFYGFRPIERYCAGSLLFAVTFALLVWLVCWLLWRRRIFVKI
jgi:predicted acyltransferase